MSVINNVLKDLESRSSQFTPIEIAGIDKTTQSSGERSRLPIVILMVFVVFVISAATYFYQLKTENESVANNAIEPSVSSTPIVEETTIEEATVEAEIVVEAPPNQLIGLQFKETSEQLSLEFLLREKAISYLKERSENSFTYHLKNIESEIGAPLMNGNQWLDKLSMRENDKGIDVTFNTLPGVLVNTDQIREEDETVWIINLQKMPTPVAIEEPESIPVAAKPENDIVLDTPANPIETGEAPPTSESKPVKVEIKTARQNLSDSGQLAKATELVRKRQWKTAETLLLSLLDGPQDMAARKQLLGIYAQPKYVQKYSTLARQSSEKYPQQSLFKTEYARSLFQSESYPMVIALLEALDSRNAKQLALMAASYQRLDQHNNAIEYYRQSLELNRNQARSWIGLGISLEHEARLDKALQSYKTAARIGNINARLQQFVEQRSRMLAQAIN